MKVLGSLTARFLIHFGAIEMSAVILSCYAIAVSLGHVKPWLPTISACGDHPPEEFLFRFGIFLGAMLLEVEAFALYLSKKSSGLTFFLGATASFCLGVVAVVGANENGVLHTTSAVIFFVFEDIMSVFLTVDLLGKMSWCSLGVKVTSCTVACIATIFRILLINGNLKVDDSFPALAIVEWSNTAAIVVYQLSLADEISNLFVGIFDSDGSTKSTPDKTPPTEVPMINPPTYEMANPLPSKKPVILVENTV